MYELEPRLVHATVSDYSHIQNMWRFYVYDIGRECGFNIGWVHSPINIKNHSSNLKATASSR